jgi:hypothetical protein
MQRNTRRFTGNEPYRTYARDRNSASRCFLLLAALLQERGQGNGADAKLDQSLTRMPDVVANDALARRFPDRARSIRRLQAEDATFRAICEDYAEALQALAYWQAPERSCEQRAEEYRRLVEELEEEALAALGACESA